MRIGIKTEEHDHGGDSLGWYHPKCLWKTFCYKSNANPRIRKISDIVNHRSLEDDEVEVFNKLIRNSQSIDSPAAGIKRELDVHTIMSPISTKGSVTLSVAGDDLLVAGDTFNVKDILKEAGGRWNGANKCWTFPSVSHPTVLALFNVTGPLLAGQSKVLETRQLQTAAGGAPGPSSAPAPKYAMAGTIVFKLVKNTQDIEVRGNVEHIADRLRSAGGAQQSTHWYVGVLWSFSTQSRAGARKFFCMPDDLPPADEYLEIDLAELGRKQVLYCISTVTY